MAHWFLYHNEVVSGPFSTEEVKSLAAQRQVEESSLIWGRLQKEWKPLRWWMVELPSLLSRHTEVKDSRLWHYAQEGNSHGPFTRDDLITRLKDVELDQNVLVWTKGMKAWAPIFEFHDLLDEIGINKRQFPRAEIEGRVTVKLPTKAVEGVLITISEGGFGANGLTDMSIGQVVSVEVISDAFYDTIHAKAEVRYITESGYVGFKFQHINMESRGAIIQYVKSAGRTMLKAAS